jgi:hypothetical protein
VEPKWRAGGVQVEARMKPVQGQVESRCRPGGAQVDGRRSPGGGQVEPRWRAGGAQMDGRWSPGGGRVEPRWRAGGAQVECRWSSDGGPVEPMRRAGGGLHLWAEWREDIMGGAACVRGSLGWEAMKVSVLPEPLPSQGLALLDRLPILSPGKVCFI